MDRKPLAPVDVHDVIFAKAPLGKRGYHEDQVDDFLDRVEATLAGKDTLTSADVRTVAFGPAPLIKRGYHEQQVDNFLDLVVGELEYREHGAPNDHQAPNDHRAPTDHHAPNGAVKPAAPAPDTAAPTPAEQTSPMLFAVPPSLPVDEPTETATQPVKPDQPVEEAPPPRPTSPAEVLTLPLPPAQQGTRGYRAGDVEKLAKLVAAALTGADQDDDATPTADDIADTKLSRSFFIGQGYHTGVVDVVKAAWVEELRRRES